MQAKAFTRALFGRCMLLPKAFCARTSILRSANVPLRLVGWNGGVTAVDNNCFRRIKNLRSSTSRLASTFNIQSRKSIRLNVGIKEQRIPLSVADLHLRNEQLPFAYFFQNYICDQQLADSLQRVVHRHFALAGGRISDCFTAIQCSASDSIPFKVQEIDCTLAEWQSQALRHEHREGQHPVLLPLFDPLFSSSKQTVFSGYQTLLSVIVTYFQCGATCLGVTTNHCLADTASCIQLVETWGEELGRMASAECTDGTAINATAKDHSESFTISWNRSMASTTGMMTADTAELMSLPTAIVESSILPSWMTLPFWNNDYDKQTKGSDEPGHLKILPEIHSLSPPIPAARVHEYLVLRFSPMVLAAMKAHGQPARAEKVGSSEEHSFDTTTTSFVSTNDLVTAATWLLKRQLSKEPSWNLSVVVNLRGRCGVKSFDEVGGGLFGNAISNVVAHLAPSTAHYYGKTSVRLAAKSIRRALTVGISEEIPNRIATSRIGLAMGTAPSTVWTFPTTSWRQLSPWKIRFSDRHAIVAFVGQPVCPLPLDGSAVYSSVLHSSSDGGCTVELFLPSSQADEATELHKKLCRSYTDWHSALETKTKMEYLPD